jgi:DNA-binding HxlR family transcriptional regulator
VARELREQDAGCAIAQAAAVVGEWWSLLIVREVTRGRHRFDDLHAELGISRRVLAERLKHLLDNGVLERRPYQQRPTRYEYRLTAAGRALAPVLAGLQDWGERFVLGDGTSGPGATPTEIDRMHGLVGTAVPHPLALPVIGGGEVAGDGGLDVVASDARVTVLLAAPGDALAAFLGALGASAAAFAEAGVAVRAVTTREPGEPPGADASGAEAPTELPGAEASGAGRPDAESRAARESGPGRAFPVLSDAELTLCAALRLPTFRTGHTLHLKPAVIVADARRTIRHVLYPIADAGAAIKDALRLATGVTSRFVR